jgi:hypothetical protein
LRGWSHGQANTVPGRRLTRAHLSSLVGTNGLLEARPSYSAARTNDGTGNRARPKHHPRDERGHQAPAWQATVRQIRYSHQLHRGTSS